MKILDDPIIKDINNLLSLLPDIRIRKHTVTMDLLDAIKSFNCDQVELMFNGEIKPIIIKNAEDDKLTQLILPIRTY